MIVKLPTAVLLEDEDPQRFLLGLMLTELGFDVLWAWGTVGEAQQLLSAEDIPPVSLAVLDYHLADGVGDEVARKLRELWGNKVRIVSLSARWPEDPQRPEQGLYDQLLGKPCTLEELQDAIRLRDP